MKYEKTGVQWKKNLEPLVKVFPEITSGQAYRYLKLVGVIKQPEYDYIKNNYKGIISGTLCRLKTKLREENV